MSEENSIGTTKMQRVVDALTQKVLLYLVVALGGALVSLTLYIWNGSTAQAMEAVKTNSTKTDMLEQRVRVLETSLIAISHDLSATTMQLDEVRKSQEEMRKTQLDILREVKKW